MKKTVFVFDPTGDFDGATRICTTKNNHRNSDR